MLLPIQHRHAGWSLALLLCLLLASAGCDAGAGGAAGSGGDAGALGGLTVDRDDPAPGGDAIALADAVLAQAKAKTPEEQQAAVDAGKQVVAGQLTLRRDTGEGDVVAVSLEGVERAVGLLLDAQVPLATRAAVGMLVSAAVDPQRDDDASRYGPAIKHLAAPHGR